MRTHRDSIESIARNRNVPVSAAAEMYRLNFEYPQPNTQMPRRVATEDQS